MRSPGQAFDVRAALTAEVRAAADDLADAVNDPKAVHRCRVRLKRARALAHVGAGAAPGLQAVFDEGAHNAMQALAQARTLTALADASRKAAKKAPKKASAALIATAGEFDAVRAASPAPDFDALHGVLRDLLALAQVWPDASARQIVRACREIAGRAKRARRRALAADAPARARHLWRKRESDRRHAAEILGPAWPRRRKLGASAKVVAALGRERDATLLIKRLEAAPEWAGGEDAARRALKTLKRRRRTFAERADDAGATLRP